MQIKVPRFKHTFVLNGLSQLLNFVHFLASLTFWRGTGKPPSQIAPKQFKSFFTPDALYQQPFKEWSIIFVTDIEGCEAYM